MNIHNGGSEFILLSMTFGIVQHNVNHRWVTYRKPLVNILLSP